MSTKNYKQLITTIENFDFSKLPLKKIYDGEMKYGEIYKLIFNKEELDFMENSTTYGDFEGYDEFIKIFEEKVHENLVQYEKSLPKHCGVFEFRFVSLTLHKHIINIIKKEYLDGKAKIKNWTDKGYLNIKIIGVNAKEIIKEIEADEEKIIFNATEKTLSPYHNNKVYLDGRFESSYKKYVRNNF